jgi:hypothetical protein
MMGGAAATARALRTRAASLALLVLVGAGCGSTPAPQTLPTEAAPPQRVELGWEERLPSGGPGLVFRVHRFAVTADGWEADVGLENRTEIAWRLPGAVGAVPTSFGVMLFTSDALDEVEQRSRDGELPGVREAQRYEPRLPARLAPGAEWRGTIAARGALAAGLFVRIVLGPFVAVGDPPKGMRAGFSWITDHAHRLHG